MPQDDPPPKPNEEKADGAASFDARTVEAKNVSGSTAGAGSGDFHVYRQQRRRELDRLAQLRADGDEEAFAAEEYERSLATDERTKRRAAKRRRKKDAAQARRKKAKAAKAEAAAGDSNGVH